MTLLVAVHTSFIVLILDITFFNSVTIILVVRALLDLPVLAKTLLNYASIFIAVTTVLVLF